MKELNFRKIKIVFKKDKNELKTEFFERLLQKEDLTLNEKWFLRGCKHITERHYTESIKRFQLSKNLDSVFMILAVSFKIADKFMFGEYMKNIDNTQKFGEMLNKFGIEVFIKIDEKEYKLTPELIEKMEKALN
jgi:hypothetical protein